MKNVIHIESDVKQISDTKKSAVQIDHNKPHLVQYSDNAYLQIDYTKNDDSYRFNNKID